MPYVVLDPVGQYPRHLLTFLGGGLGKAGIAVFTSEARWMLWRDKWSHELGRYVVETHLPGPGRGVAALAADLRRRHPDIEGVVPWDEETVLLGARLGELLGLDWNPLRVMERCRDKAVMKAWLRRQRTVRVNASATVADREDALRFRRKVGRWPIVVKPTAGSGSEDVYFPRDDDELLRDCERVRAGGNGRVLLEEYIGGDELVVNGIADAQGDLLVTDVWHYDRRTSHGVPNLFHTTRRIATSEPVFVQVAEYAAQVIEALGLRRCPIHMEVKVDDRGPCLIEVGARFPGGNLAVLASKLHGRSLFELGACQYVSDVPLRGDGHRPRPLRPHRGARPPWHPGGGDPADPRRPRRGRRAGPPVVRRVRDPPTRRLPRPGDAGLRHRRVGALPRPREPAADRRGRRDRAPRAEVRVAGRGRRGAGVSWPRDDRVPPGGSGRLDGIPRTNRR